MVLAPTLTLSAGSGAIVRPTFSRDFAGEKTLNNGTGPAIAFTRASDATYFDADGVLQTASSDTPRFDHSGGSSLGLLIEESRTNSIRNSQAGGSTNGVIGSGGVMPTNWVITANANGITSEIIGTGTEDGLAYIDIKYSGTPTSNGFVYPTPESATQISASSGQTWTFSTYCKLAAGSLSGATVRIYTAERASGGANLANTAATLTPTTASLASQRSSVTRTFNNGSTNFALGIYEIAYTNGNPIDLTLRIAAPQLEQGAFATSYIPTTSAAVTRSADSAIVNPISSFYNASEGTLFAEFSRYSIAGSGSIFVADNETIGNRVGLFGTVAQVAISDVFTTIDALSVVAGTVYRGILGYKANDHAATLNGAAVDTNTAVGVPTAATHLRLGAEAFAGGELSGHIRRIAYFPKRLSNALLQSLTT
jgi:hypothetical protein